MKIRGALQTNMTKTENPKKLSCGVLGQQGYQMSWSDTRGCPASSYPSADMWNPGYWFVIKYMSMKAVWKMCHFQLFSTKILKGCLSNPLLLSHPWGPPSEVVTLDPICRPDPDAPGWSFVLIWTTVPYSGFVHTFCVCAECKRLDI